MSDTVLAILRATQSHLGQHCGISYTCVREKQGPWGAQRMVALENLIDLMANLDIINQSINIYGDIPEHIKQ